MEEKKLKMKEEMERSLDLSEWVRIVCDFLHDLKKNPDLDVEEWLDRQDRKSKDGRCKQ